MDTIQIDAAYVLAGDSKFRLSCRSDRGQAPTLSFTYNRASNLVFLHVDGNFLYGLTGFYPEANCIELYLDLHSVWMLWGNLKNIVDEKGDAGEQPGIQGGKHPSASHVSSIIQEYMVKTEAISIMSPLKVNFKPRSPEGFKTYVALIDEGIPHDSSDPLLFRIKFWLTERAIPDLDYLQRYFLHENGRRTQPVYLTITFQAKELADLRCQLELLKNRYVREMKK